MTIVDTSGVITIPPLVNDESGSISCENNITSGSAGWFNISLDNKLLAKYYVVEQTFVYGMFTKVGWESLLVVDRCPLQNKAVNVKGI